VKTLPGKPDIVLKKHNIIIFVNGCFWHGHKNCSNAKVPVSNNEFWSHKISSNTNRDLKNRLILNKMGWRVLFVWECDIIKRQNKTLKRISKFILDK